MKSSFAVTPDEKFLGGGFVRIGHVPATDRLVVTFGPNKFAQQSGDCPSGPAYKEYTLDMQPTGESGIFRCDQEWGGDIAGTFVDNVYYYVRVTFSVP
jgi:hypothetical protein